ncbi:prepilin peptidase, partial [Phenylobacterium sp.]|uniref:prepilin peptidase n=1 Tax=Phenylobacterium sp. TaxID=1871053 RepID=UPI003784AB94
MPHALDLPLIAGALLSGGAMILAGAGDIRRYSIPNRLCVAVVFGYGLAGFVLGPTTMLDGLVVGLGVLLCGALLFGRGWVGGGDVKLATAAALWAGSALFSQFALAMSASGAVLAALMLSPARRLMPAPPAGETGEGL